MEIKLNSGNIIDPYCGIIGISLCKDKIGEESYIVNQLTEGYDGYLGEFNSKLTKEDRIEIADLMIARWTEYKESLK